MNKNYLATFMMLCIRFEELSSMSMFSLDEETSETRSHEREGCLWEALFEQSNCNIDLAN